MKPEDDDLDSPAVSLNALASLLSSAARLARGLTNDGHLPRLLGAFLRLPEADRPLVLGILEREVAAREASVRAEDGLVGPPSRFANLYVRVFDNERDSLGVTRDQMVCGTLEATVFMQNLPAVLAAEMETAVGIALEALDDDEARAMADMYDDVLAALAESER